MMKNQGGAYVQSICATQATNTRTRSVRPADATERTAGITQRAGDGRPHRLADGPREERVERIKDVVQPDIEDADLKWTASRQARDDVRQTAALAKGLERLLLRGQLGRPTIELRDRRDVLRGLTVLAALGMASTTGAGDM